MQPYREKLMYRKITEEEKTAYNYGLKHAKSRVTNMILVLQSPDELDNTYSSVDMHKTLRIICDAIDKEIIK